MATSLMNQLSILTLATAIGFSSSLGLSQTPAAPALNVGVEATEISLSWSEVAGATGYSLVYADYPDASVIESIDLGASSQIVADLPVGSAYYVAVQAYNEQGLSQFSNIDYFHSQEANAEAAACAIDNDDSRYAWPFKGENGRDWVIHNYVDRATGLGISDYASEPGVSGKSYDGHNGIDIDIPTFREMDAGVNIYAIHKGLVTDVIENFPDRETACVSNDWNVVTVQQSDGNTVYYGHMRTNSAAVVEGQLVSKGDLLGQVGSSGCSTAAHLHLELRSATNAVIDPFFNSQWCDAPPYEKPVSVFTGILLEVPANQYADAFKDPPADLKTVSAGTRLLPILHSANGSVGESVGVRVLKPSGEVHLTTEHVFTTPPRHGYWFWNIGTVDDVGVWTVQYLANGIAQYMLQVDVVL